MDKREYRDMWVYAEHDGGALHPVTLELCCEVRKLCDASGDRLAAVAAGPLPEAELEKLRGCGVERIILVDGRGCERYNTEAYTNLFTVLCRKYRPSAVFIGATVNGATLRRGLRRGWRPAAHPTQRSWCIMPKRET